MGSPKDNVRMVTRAASSTMKRKKGKGTRKKSNTTSFPRPKQIFSRRRQKYHKHSTPAHAAKETSQRAASSCRGSARILLVIIGILLSVPNRKTKRRVAHVKNQNFTREREKLTDVS